MKARQVLARFDDQSTALAFWGDEALEILQQYRHRATRLGPLAQIDSLDCQAWHVVLTNSATNAVEAAARVLVFDTLDEARRGYTATLYDWPAALPPPMSWPVAEVSRLLVVPGPQSPGNPLRRLWQALQQGFAPPLGPRWWVGSIGAWRLQAAWQQALQAWPAWPDSGFVARWPSTNCKPGSVPSRLPPHWQLFWQAGARALAWGHDPLFDNAPDALLVIDWNNRPT